MKKPISSSGAPDRLAQAARLLSATLGRLAFAPPVTHTYNPLEYAWAPHEAYLRLAGAGPKRVVFLGMNPGPFGMVQTGVPFGEIAAVRDWMGIHGAVGRPAREHPKKLVQGFNCPRSEVSGRRLWGLFSSRFTTPAAFFQDHFVANYCPLAFFQESGKNHTPDQLPAAEEAPLSAACDAHLAEVVAILQPEWVIGVGAFAARQARRALGDNGPRIGTILHPSPASPAANRGWAEAALKQLQDLGVW